MYIRVEIILAICIAFVSQFASGGCSKATTPSASLASSGKSPGTGQTRTPDAGSGPSEINLAFQTAFPDGAAETVPITTADGSVGEYYELIFTPKKILDIGGGLVVLVSKGANPDACHACDGKLDIRLLTHRGSSMGLSRSPEGMMIDGDGFGSPPQWKDEMDGASHLIVVETRYFAQGCGGATTKHYRLTSSGVVEINALTHHRAERCV